MAQPTRINKAEVPTSTSCALCLGAGSTASIRRSHVRILALLFSVDNILTLGYLTSMNKATEAAKELARLSVASRRRKWGAKGVHQRMRAWGKLGGRPRGKKGNRNGN